MAKAKYAKTIAAHFPDALIPELDAFCRTHAITRSRALSLIVARWYRDNCPPPTQEDSDWLNRKLRPYLTSDPIRQPPQLVAAPVAPYTPDETLGELLNPRSLSDTKPTRESGNSASA